jgi:hypothetical protein
MLRSWPILLFAAATLVTLAIFGGYFYISGGAGIFSDGIGYYAPLRSLAFDGDLEVADEYQYFAATTSMPSGEPRWPNPIPRYSKYTVGMALVLSPFFLLGHLAVLCLRAVGVSVAANGLSWPYELFYSTGSLLLGICGLYLAYRAARAWVGQFPAALAVVGVWFASSLAYYLAVVPSMSHAVSQFLVSAFLYLTLTQDWLGERRARVLMGLTLGLATLVRPQDALFGVVPLALILLGSRTQGRGAPRDLLSLGWLGFGVGLAALLQLSVYRIQFGDLAHVPYLYEGAASGMSASFVWTSPKVASVLFSGFHGLFTWHPILLLAVVGLLWSVRTRQESIALLLAFLLQVALVSSWYNWWQGAAFGGRMFSSCTFVFVMGLASLWSHARQTWARRAAVLLTLGFIAWNALLVLQYTSRMIPAEAAVSVGLIIRNQFRVVPFFLERFAPK